MRRETRLSAQDEDRLRQAAELFCRRAERLCPLKNSQRRFGPTRSDEAYFLQDTIALALGKIGGWKVGVPTADATPLFGPMPLMGGFANSGDVLSETFRRMRGLEAEIAFCFGKDLPPREEPYTRAEVIAAIGSCHPGD